MWTGVDKKIRSIFNVFSVTLIILLILDIIWYVDGNILDGTKLFPGQEKVEELVREWAPLVWLAPNEKYMPGDVTEFLQHVHAEKAKSKKTIDEPSYEDIDNMISYYDTANEFSTILGQETPNTWERRDKRMFNFIIDLPLGEYSSNWYLVTNDAIEDLLSDPSSFIYGQSPSVGNVPIYSMVKFCNSSMLDVVETNDLKSNLVDTKPEFDRRRSTYIPVSNSLLKSNATTILSRNLLINKSNISMPILNYRTKRDTAVNATVLPETNSFEQNQTTISEESSTEEVPTQPPTNAEPETMTMSSTNENTYPSFHVTYWMFYPYSQGKSICTVSLGPLGHLPIPQIFGMCLGTKRDFGSHVGDWEHMTLSFNGRAEPDEMYVSAHDAGAYYAYERLTGTFEFRRQETRKGILQHPNFPRTVITSKNHPVLFSAQGSHGLWTAPGKHRFVRVARLFDVNGFGTAWPTWKRVEISYENERSGRSTGPEWLRFNGRWGNPKSKCHPLRRVGLNFCEFTDGPTGIPRKTPHFHCPK